MHIHFKRKTRDVHSDVTWNCYAVYSVGPIYAEADGNKEGKRGEYSMGKVYFTITGLNHYYGNEFFRQHMTVKLKKEPDNEYDREAIKVMLKGIGKIGYVANSTRTVIGDTMSAGRLYDRIGKKAKGCVEYVLPQGVVCSLIED